MANHKVTIANSKRELKVAVKSSSPVIILEDEEFFWEMEKSLKKNKVAKTTKKAGNIGAVLGGLCLVALGMGITLLACGVVATALGLAVDDLKEYDILLNYKARNVILIKKTGKNKVNLEKDTFEGADVKEILKNAVK